MLLALLLAHAIGRAVVVVSPGGAISTVEGGVAEAKRLLWNHLADSIEVQVNSGNYRIKYPIALSATESNLHIVGTGPTMPRLIGGKQLMNWHPVRDKAVLARLKLGARANLMECDLTGEDKVGSIPGLSERGFGEPERDAGLELFYNGKPMQLARYPNAGAPNGGWLRIAGTPSPNAIIYNDDEPSRWHPSDDLWAMGYWQYDWAESYEHVTSLDTAAKRVSFAGANFKYPPQAGRRFYFLNVLEELDEPGEWYADARAGRIYFWPPSPLERGEVVVSTLRSSMFILDRVTNVRFEGLDMEAGCGGGISINGGADNWVGNCVVRNFGTFGVSITNAKTSGVKGCDLTGLGETGISLIGGDRKTLTAANLLAEDNHIWAYARWCRTYHPAIFLEGVGNHATHNWISDAPHQAMLVNGNDHVMEYNDIANVCTETGDAGAIYMGRDTTMRGEIIRFNRFRNLSPKVNTDGNFTEVMGVYLDDCWAGTTIFGNIFDMRGDGIMLGGGRDNTIANNVFIDCHPAIHFDGRGKGWAAKYFASWEFTRKMAFVNPSNPPYSTRYPKLANIQSVDYAFPAGNAIDSNVSLGGEWLRLLDHLTGKDFESHDNVVQPGSGSVSAAFMAAPKTFVPIPVDQIGVTTKTRPIDRLGR